MNKHLFVLASFFAAVPAFQGYGQSPHIPNAKLPAAKSSAHELIFRQYSAGHVLKNQKLTTFTLSFDGVRASLRTQPQTLKGSETGTEWLSDPEETFVGTLIRADANSMTIDLAVKEGTMSLQCSRSSVQVARANAVRIPNPKFTDECGDEGIWFPAKTTKKSGWKCESEGPLWLGLFLADPPGIEHLFVNDDCAMQGGGYRLVESSGKVFPVRREEPVNAPSFHSDKKPKKQK
jgi:hypothetical protein